MTDYVIITGGTRGIGAAIAREMAARGYDLLLGYRSDTAAAEALAAELRLQVRVDLLQADVTDRPAMKAALTATVAEHGAPWAVVANAGFTRDGLLMWMKDEDWDAVIDGALGGFYNLVKPVLADMLKARRGRIVTVASVTGQMGNAGQTNYAAAKGGLIAASKALAREVAKRGITVNAVAPGLIATELTAGLNHDAMIAGIPLGRAGVPEDVAPAVGFLCSEGAAYITGQVLGINGGLYT
ncbi:MAG: 3-oxoacyl-ACP reductase FabG [Planctomycetota bacterium]|nr:3-oxoacyl-ACP reductase FabG [Planctomycetota bacterium]